MKDPGAREALVTFETGTATTDDHGGETKTWATITTAYARIRYGTGQERREAAQERQIQAATFECDWNPTLAGVAVTDRITFEDETWDITNKAPLGHEEIHFTALRST